LKNIIVLLFITIVLFVAFFWVLGRGIDKYFQNQDNMLCESAQISGNPEYLERCGK
jgi:uncharacterized membrane protein